MAEKRLWDAVTQLLETTTLAKRQKMRMYEDQRDKRQMKW